MKRIFSLMLMLVLVITASAQQEYYTSIDGTKGGATLKTALYNLIKNHKQISYGSGSSSTWGAFYTTDAVVENGQRRVLDMYSNEKRYFTSKGSAVSGMNIEHSVAKSWWGGGKNNAYCDLHHLNPSDQNANSRKSNYPLGELTSVSWDNGVTFVGKANIDGSSQNAYEPCDEYKGDFARVFMYMFTCYQDLTWEYTWMNYENSTYPTLKPWAVKLLLKWHKQDPVSEKEVNRNNAVYAVQGNRNPYVDYPQLADYVWGDSINYVFHINGDVEDGTGSGNTGGDGNTGSDNDDDYENVDGWKIYLDEDFNDSELPFYTYEAAGKYLWEIYDNTCAKASSYVNSTGNNAESWMILPSYDLSKDSIVLVSFDYVTRYNEPGKVAGHNQLRISDDYDGDVENASWEVIDFGVIENSTDWTMTNSGEIAIPVSYLGKENVTLAFFYKGTTTKAGTFEVDNVVVKALEGGNVTNGEDGGEGNEGEDGNTGGTVGNGGNFTSGSFTLVTDAAQLTVGDSIIITYENYVLGEQYNNYRQKTDVLISDNTVTYLADNAQVILLEEGVVDGTFAFNVGNGYLAASSSSSNYLNTVTTLDANGSWAIAIENSVATVKAQGDKTHNILQYNTGAPRFSCYTGTQKNVTIYAKSPVSTGIEHVQGENGKVQAIYDLTGRCVETITKPGIYIVGGAKKLVR